MGAFVFRKSGKISAITDGGEGTIYDLGNGSDVIKVYKPVVNIAAKERKVDLLLKKSLPAEVIGPTEKVVDNKGHFIGFVMNKIDGVDFKNLYTKKFIKSNNITLKDILKMLIDIKDIMERLHAENIFIGDLNDQNILFDNRLNVYFIDVDSYTVDSEYCTVAMDLFKDPKLVGNNFNAETDIYSYCVLAWKSITRIHPFGGTMNPDMNILDRINKGISVIDRPSIIIPRTISSWKNLSPNLLKMFKDVFENGRRIIGDEFEDMYGNLTFCKADGIYYFSKYNACPICDSNAKVVTKPVSQGLVSGLTLVTMLNYDRVKSVLNSTTYIDNDDYVIDMKSGKRVKFDTGVKYYFTKSGAIVKSTSDQFIITKDNEEYKFDKKFRSDIVVSDNDIYYISRNCTLYKVTVLDNGNGVTNLATCSINSYFEVYKDKYCIVNVEDKQLIINSNGYHCQIPYSGSVVNYGIHYDEIYNSWLIILEDRSGKFNTFIISGTNCLYKTDRIPYDCLLNNLCIYNGTIYIPIDGKIRGYSYKKDIFKDFESSIVGPDSKLIKSGSKFTIVNDDNIYTLGK